jgi:hypothetical protein
MISAPTTTPLSVLLDQPLYCVINAHKTYNDFKVVEGLNYCSDCEPVSIRIVPFHKLPKLLTPDCFVSEVEIPDDAVCNSYRDSELSTDKFIIKNFTPIAELSWWTTHPEWCRQAVANCWIYFRYVPSENQTHEMALSTVRRNGYSLKFVAAPSSEIYEAAVDECGYAIRDVPEPEQTPELCRIAIENNSRSLQYILNKTEDLCLTAVRKNPLSIQYVPNSFRNTELCEWAIINSRGRAIEFLEKTEEFIKLATSFDNLNSQYLTAHHHKPVA